MSRSSIWISKPPLGSQVNFGHPLSRGLVGCWLMNEGGGLYINDISGNRNRGTLTNMTTAGSGWILGKYLGFDGSDDYITVPDAASLLLSDFTIELWLKADANPGTAITNPITKPNNSENYNFGWGHSNADFRQAWQFYDTGGTWRKVKYATTLVGGVWYHLVGTYNKLKFIAYLNGVLDNSVDATTTPKTTAGALEISRVGKYFAGKIAKVCIWNRALSAAEVRSLYVSPFQIIYRPERRIWSIVETQQYNFVATGGGIKGGESVLAAGIDYSGIAGGIKGGEALLENGIVFIPTAGGIQGGVGVLTKGIVFVATKGGILGGTGIPLIGGKGMFRKPIA